MPQINVTQDSNSDWIRAIYVWAGAGLDRAMPPHMSSQPFELSGVDLREFGSLLRFPGFKPTVIGSVPIAGDPAPKYIRRVNLNKGSSGHELRGFVILRRHVLFMYYDTETRAWASKILRYNFGGLQLNSDSFSATCSGKALYLSWCGQAEGSGTASAGTRTIRIKSEGFVKAGDTIIIERDTARAEEAIVDSYTGTEGRIDQGKTLGGIKVLWQEVNLRQNLQYTHGPGTWLIEGGSGAVGMTVVTHDGTDFLIEQAGPLHEDGEFEIDADMIGGTTEPPTTTTQDVLCGKPKLDYPIRDGANEFSGSVASGDPAGPTGLELQIRRSTDGGANWSTISMAGQGPTFRPDADGTFERDMLFTAVKKDYLFAVRARLPDIGDETPGEWVDSDTVTCGAAAPIQYSGLATIDVVHAGDANLTGTLPSSATSGAMAQAVKYSDGKWVSASGINTVGTGTFVIALSQPAVEGQIYSVVSKDSTRAEWSGNKDDSDGRLASIQKVCITGWSTLATFFAPPSLASGVAKGYLTGGQGALSQGQICRWNDVTDKWAAVGGIYALGQHSSAAWELPLPSITKEGDRITIRTRMTSTGPWSGDLDAGDGRLMSISVEVSA